MINSRLKQYIETEIIPKYAKYYSHGPHHINRVIKSVLTLAEYYKLDENMAYVVAAYHDIGLNVSRAEHERESSKFLVNDSALRDYFDEEQIMMMKEAVEDHRGSRKEPPRNIYGKILSDSDRDFDIEIQAKRQLATSLKNFPNLTSFDEHFENCYQYMMKRINSTGKFNLWTDCPTLVKQRDKFNEDFLNKGYTKSIYKREWDKIQSDGTMEKIKNYYEDF